eukprot:2980355-Amphidinium_carterae.1
MARRTPSPQPHSRHDFSAQRTSKLADRVCYRCSVRFDTVDALRRHLWEEHRIQTGWRPPPSSTLPAV